MTDANHVLKHLLVETIFKSRMIDHPKELDALIDETVGKLYRAFHTQDNLLCEKEVAQRFPFLTLIKLRNMRTRHIGPKYLKMGSHRNSRVYYKHSDIETWIIEQYQLGSFVEEAISLAGKGRK